MRVRLRQAPAPAAPSRRRDDRGVTLLEVLIAVALLGVVIVPLTSAMISFIRNTNATTDRMSESHDVQIVSAYFAQDVQSVGTRAWTAAGISPQQSVDVPGFTGSFPCGSGTPLVRFRWDNPSVTPGVLPSETRVSYVVQDVGTERQLHRLTCVGSATVISDTVLVHNVDKTAVGFPAVACTNTGGAAQACGSPTPPASVKLTIKIRAPRNTGPDPVTIVLQGQRRQS